MLEEYLLFLNESEMTNKISDYEVVKYTTPKDITTGLLRFDKPPIGKCFLFVLPNEKEISFHTIGMKFSIDILFYNSNGELETSYSNVKPGIKNIPSKNKVKYVLEIPKNA